MARKTAYQRKPHPERAEDILAAARDVFAEKGYEGASITDIAQKAGIVEGTIYKHFKNKRDLLFQVTRNFYEPLIDKVGDEVRGIRGARNQLRFLVWQQLRELTKNTGLSRVVIREIRPHEDEYQATVVDLQRRYTALIVDIIQSGKDNGEFRPDTPVKLVRDVLMGSVEHIVWRAVNSRRDIDPGAMADDLLALVLGGVAATGDAAAGDAAPSAPSPDLARRLEDAATRIEKAAAKLTEES